MHIPDHPFLISIFPCPFVFKAHFQIIIINNRYISNLKWLNNQVIILIKGTLFVQKVHINIAHFVFLYFSSGNILSFLKNTSTLWSL